MRHGLTRLLDPLACLRAGIRRFLGGGNQGGEWRCWCGLIRFACTVPQGGPFPPNKGHLPNLELANHSTQSDYKMKDFDQGIPAELTESFKSFKIYSYKLSSLRVKSKEVTFI